MSPFGRNWRGWAMLIIPAIDLLDGRCVRLREGDYATAQVFEDDPAAAARRFFSLGARRLHVVDLDAAKSGRRENVAAVAAILSAAADYDAEVQVGGGLRTLEAIGETLADGAAFAIAGTAAAREPDFLRRATEEFPGRVMLAADIRDGKVAVAGWRKDSEKTADDLLSAAAAHPPAAIIHTDIRRDGMMSGVDAVAMAAAAEKSPCPLIVSGGVCGEDDARALATAHANIGGVIVGRAAYENPPMLARLLKTYNAAAGGD